VVAAYEQDIAICREAGDQHGEGMTLNNLGVALAGLGRFEEAITAYQDAAGIFREEGDESRERSALDGVKAARAAGSA
jgi:hypothetical protein